MTTPDVAIARAELHIRTGIGDLRDLFRHADKIDKIDAVLEAVVALERITHHSQAVELADRAQDLRTKVDAAKQYIAGVRLGQPRGRSWDPAPAARLGGLAEAAVALAAQRAGIDAPKAYAERITVFGA